MNAPLNDKLKKVKWGEYRINQIFEGARGNFDIQKKHINGKGELVITSGLIDDGVLGKSDIDSKIFPKNTLTVDMFGCVFYRPFEYKMVTHARVFSLIPKFKMSQNQVLFVSNSLRYLRKIFEYGNMC
ncbi:MAG: restriction endonuclease subunit S, partial [Selenomonadaceae bacterium]|nr:restriction endonuclease subunit S [Selenomonadaceae bacterium]